MGHKAPSGETSFIALYVVKGIAQRFQAERLATMLEMVDLSDG
jgi:hypothetical protein